MQLLATITAAAGLLASASALPASNTNEDSAYTWQVSEWEAGCGRSGCYYYFNVTGAASDKKTAFKAYCHGTDEGYFTPCDLLSGAEGTGVAAELATYNDTVAKMGVSLQFTTDAKTPVTYNYTGHYNATYNQFASPVYGFTVKPEEVSAVA